MKEIVGERDGEREREGEGERLRIEARRSKAV